MRVCEEVPSRVGSFVDGAGVTADFNCTEYTVEMCGNAKVGRREGRGNSKSAFENCGRLVTIRKSDVVDFAGLGAISNRTRCRLEIREGEKRQPARQAILRIAKSSLFRLHGAFIRLRVPNREEWRGVFGAGIGGVPGEGRPAALEGQRPLCMCVCWAFTS